MADVPMQQVMGALDKSQSQGGEAAETSESGEVCVLIERHADGSYAVGKIPPGSYEGELQDVASVAEALQQAQTILGGAETAPPEQAEADMNQGFTKGRGMFPQGAPNGRPL